MIYPEKFEKIMEFYKRLPGIGEKSAERLALATLDMKENDILDFSENIKVAYQQLHACHICGHLTDQDVCFICSNDQRDKNLICVVEDYKNVFSFEKVGNFRGVYHVLNGLISPMDNISADDINLASLVKRIEKLDRPELILALKSSIEGETTTLYIKKIFEGKPVVISRLSYGLPSGAEIDYIDTVTLSHALNDRKQISE